MGGLYKKFKYSDSLDGYMIGNKINHPIFGVGIIKKCWQFGSDKGFIVLFKDMKMEMTYISIRELNPA